VKSIAKGETRTSEREYTADQVTELARVVAERDAALATLLGRLAAAVRIDHREDVQGYAEAIDPHGLAELLVVSRAAIWGFIEVARNVLVFAPIAVTWFGLSTATEAYATLMSQRPDLVTRPFLLLWQEGFDGVGGTMRFSTLAIVDASLIGLLIVLSLLIHFRIDVRDVALRTRVLLKESEIRGLLAHTLALSSDDADLPASAALIDQMVAEERRIYERGMEREQRLFDLETTAKELRAAAADLARVAEALRSDRVERR
jgi:ABC-type amino acid transport system permease subunit